MLFNRHFFIIVFSVLFIGMIFWWQKPEAAASAMSRGEYTFNSYSLVKNYWKRLDYRQFELASEMTTLKASIQKVSIELTTKKNIFLAKITLGSVIDKKQENDYLVNVEQTEKGWLITSINCISGE